MMTGDNAAAAADDDLMSRQVIEYAVESCQSSHVQSLRQQPASDRLVERSLTTAHRHVLTFTLSTILNTLTLTVKGRSLYAWMHV